MTYSGYQIRRRTAQSNEADLPADLSPLLRRVYANRGFVSSDLDLSLAGLLPWHTLSNIDAAASLLADTLSDSGLITIVGDYDVDGATSTALAVSTLRSLGGQVNFFVPDRFKFGYGLSPAIVTELVNPKPSLIVTVDNGISSVDGVEAAHAAGIRVLVTDHHLAPEQLPDADAIVNPNLPNDPFPSKALAGVGTLFYVLLALRHELRRRNWFVDGRREPNLADCLDLVALGTVADLVKLDRNNRILVEQGLRRIRAGRTRPGIEALLQISKKNQQRLGASDLGFALGPRLNAAGRLADMSTGINCLLAETPESAWVLASELDSLNRERRDIQLDMESDASQVMKKLTDDAQILPIGLSLQNEAWHEGVVGLLASRVKDRFSRPVFAFAPAAETPDALKGSGRSVSGYHIRDALDRIATRNPGLIQKFGGHAMAAGLSIASKDFERFSAAFAADADEMVPPEALNGVVDTDGELSSSEFSLETAELLRNAGPWGQGCPESTFDGEFVVEQARLVGAEANHLKMTLRNGDAIIDAMAFNRKDCPDTGVRLRAAFKLDVNEYRGRLSPQILIDALEWVDQPNKS